MNHDEIRKRMRSHLIAFIAILLLSLMAAGTVLAGETNRSAVLAIAAVQALIVLAAMMHAHREGPWVRGLIAFCALFVAALAGILYLGYHDTIDGTEHVGMSAPEHDAPAETEADPDSAETEH
jgi:heme/copper-type cytochrome/quinol oxidase subunit 4